MSTPMIRDNTALMCRQAVATPILCPMIIFPLAPLLSSIRCRVRSCCSWSDAPGSLSISFACRSSRSVWTVSVWTLFAGWLGPLERQEESAISRLGVEALRPWSIAIRPTDF